jgi:hypothetical protein
MVAGSRVRHPVDRDAGRPGHRHWILPDDLDEELTDWGRGHFRWLGETYRLTWLDDAATQAMRRALHVEDAPR